MSIVDDAKVDIAVSYLNADPHPAALAKKDSIDAENNRKRAYARAFLAASGSVEARKATAELNQDYIAAQAEEAEATLRFENERQHVTGANMICEIWRSEQANTRKLDRF